MTRRLAAILVADVVGYSRLMEAGEANAGRAAGLPPRIVNPVVHAHGGRIVKLMGDGMLLEFPSAAGAVEAACNCRKWRTRMRTRPRGAIELRIGINLGDVIGEGDDIYGEGVNIAARLEPLAEPGGISSRARSTTR